ncbi:DUF4845 domain-containing protein [Oceanicoccus sp. KOV_DT_Chl]|uniref:DUF4845 domain-containing protein n=1 Tax=Oceanicoccus sp. KOV_DT_Chl TaxID=1904639 RepID=UPI00135A93C1|nr:DUF4845 domain-containing protein [Oceanicoccus sp. KOV_DT_Chl]
MHTPHRQTGLSLLAILFILLIIGFAATVAIKLIPVYIEGATVRSSIQSAIDKDEFKGMSTGAMKSKIGKFFEINMIEGVNARDIGIKNDKGIIKIDARYEQRLPMMYNIDVVVKFDDLLFEFKADKR